MVFGLFFGLVVEAETEIHCVDAVQADPIVAMAAFLEGWGFVAGGWLRAFEDAGRGGHRGAPVWKWRVP